jgi:hypothetical protein
LGKETNNLSHKRFPLYLFKGYNDNNSDNIADNIMDNFIDKLYINLLDNIHDIY